MFLQGVTGEKSVCGPVLLHCLHNAELFSKLAFGMGKYQELDISKLDITKVNQLFYLATNIFHSGSMMQVRDYATYMALVSNSQGRGGDDALARFNTNMGNRSWTVFCKSQL